MRKAMPAVTRQDVVLEWCDGGADLRDHDLLIWQSIKDLTINCLAAPHYEMPNLPLPDGLRTCEEALESSWAQAMRRA